MDRNGQRCINIQHKHYIANVVHINYDGASKINTKFFFTWYVMVLPGLSIGINTDSRVHQSLFLPHNRVHCAHQNFNRFWWNWKIQSFWLFRDANIHSITYDSFWHKGRFIRFFWKKFYNSPLEIVQLWPKCLSFQLIFFLKICRKLSIYVNFLDCELCVCMTSKCILQT